MGSSVCHERSLHGWCGCYDGPSLPVSVALEVVLSGYTGVGGVSVVGACAHAWSKLEDLDRVCVDVSYTVARVEWCPGVLDVTDLRRWNVSVGTSQLISLIPLKNVTTLLCRLSRDPIDGLKVIRLLIDPDARSELWFAYSRHNLVSWVSILAGAVQHWCPELETLLRLPRVVCRWLRTLSNLGEVDSRLRLKLNVRVTLRVLECGVWGLTVTVRLMGEQMLTV